ncbi:MAG TPA: hypothetical protein VNT81_10350 [Vicinamibacterales bacterium]|nr:hypothetical protein [Vicinamibacterales bacterium]
MRPRLLLLSSAVALVSTVAVAVSQQRRTGAFDQSINHPAIKYLTADTDTVVDRLNAKLRDGSAKLAFEEKTGYLRSVLDLLNVPVESQMLVYSQTSLQAQHIRMDNPRAIYFNDDVSVGYIRGAGLIEVTAQDSKMGTVFYAIHQAPAAQPTFGRDQQCLRCHLSWDTLGVPGLSVLTTFPRKSENDYANGGTVDHYRPLEERWGGWYVTAKKAPAKHMGNLPLIMPKPLAASVPTRPSLQGLFDLAGYLTPYSDIVALMVLEHQAHFSNLVTRAGWEARLGEPLRVAEAADTLADYMLFVDEAKIDSAIEGSSGFAEKFVAQGPKDAKGRSLRELDLKTRLQKYPLSYMIHSDAFKGLPEAAKNLVMGKINRVLSGEVSDPKYAHLTPPLRAAIREILNGQ